jgi:hypothetical protein
MAIEDGDGRRKKQKKKADEERRGGASFSTVVAHGGSRRANWIESAVMQIVLQILPGRKREGGGCVGVVGGIWVPEVPEKKDRADIRYR